MSQQFNSQVSYASQEEIEAVMRGFESCTIPPDEFKHSAHLTVALWYLSKSTEEEARDRMRAGLSRLLKHYGLQGYNETITLFWIKVVRRFLDDADESRSIADLANQLIATRGDSRLVFDYYSKELVSSQEAKTSWVEPDLKPFDF